MTLTNSFTGAVSDDKTVSLALEKAGGALVELLNGEKDNNRKKVYREAVNQLENVEKAIFLSDVAVAVTLIKDASAQGRQRSDDLNTAIGILDRLRGSVKPPSIPGTDAGSELRDAKKKLEASEDVLRAPPEKPSWKSVGGDQVLLAKKAISPSLDALETSQSGSSGGNPGGRASVQAPAVVAAVRVDAIDAASGILHGLTSAPASQTLKDYERAHASVPPDTLETDLDDAVDYLLQARTASKIEVDSEAKLDQSCIKGPWDVGACLGRVKKILDDSTASLPVDEQSQDRMKWLARADRSIARHLQSGEGSKKQWATLAAAVMSLLTLALLAVTWRKATAAAPTKPAPYGAISEAGEAAFMKLEEEVETQARKYQKLLDENVALQQKSEKDERELAELRPLRSLRDPETRFKADESPTLQGMAGQDELANRNTLASEIEAGTTQGVGTVNRSQGAASERQTEQAKERGEFSGNVRDDYNRAREKGDEAQQRFTKYYERPFSVSCSNLADRTVEDGKLKFKRADRTVFMAVQDRGGKTWLFPQFNVDYRPSHNMMDGIFSYPPGTSENLRLESPGYLVPSGEVWVLESPGEFVDA